MKKLILLIPIVFFMFLSCAKDHGSIASPFQTDGEMYAFGFLPKCPDIKPCDCKNSELPEWEDISPLLKVMNEYRVKAGIKPLQLDDDLNCAAEIHSLDIGQARMCTHVGTDGSSPWERAKRCNTTAYGEIVACGQRTPEAAIEAWYKSEGHRKIMLNKEFTKVGMAVYKYYWTAIFK